MRKVCLTAAALMVVMSVACGRSDEANNDNRDATVGTGGEVTNNTAMPSDTRNEGAAGDIQRWVQDVTRHNTAEIELGRIASERATNADVKAYGQMMVRDHTAAGNELKQAVGSQIQVSEQMDEEHRNLADKLRGMSGVEFDREYMNAMVDGHEQVKDLLEERARNASSSATGTSSSAGNNNTANNNAANNNVAGSNAQGEAAVNQWAAKTLPAVERHLQQAQQLRERIESGGRNTTSNDRNTNTNEPANRPRTRTTGQ